MGFSKIIDGAYLVPMGTANAVLLEHGRDLVLVDAGFPDKADCVVAAVAKLGRAPANLKHIVFTHGHPDHIGSAAALIRLTGARTYMHQADVVMAEKGGPLRPMRAAPGLVSRIGFRVFWDPDAPVETFRVDERLTDGQELPLAGGLRVIHTPGHSAGQVALLWQDGRLLVAGDAFMNLMGLSNPIGFENETEGRRSQRRLAELDFQAVAFGHGKALTRNAAARLRRAAARLAGGAA